MFCLHMKRGVRRGRDRMVVGFTTTCAISAYHHLSCEFEPRSWWDVLDTTLCDKVCQWLVTDQSFSPGTPVSSTNKTDRHDIAEILLKVALNTINLRATFVYSLGKYLRLYKIQLLQNLVNICLTWQNMYIISRCANRTYFL